MSTTTFPAYTCFAGHQKIASGALPEVVITAKHAQENSESAQPLIFENASGRQVDFDMRGTDEETLARIPSSPEENTTPAGRGRPKLGVIAREVTLLPRHWDWLATQPGGASTTLRKLVDEARRADHNSLRQRRERTYHFMLAIAGNQSDFDEANRALFTGNEERFEQLIASWPADIREHIHLLSKSV